MNPKTQIKQHPERSVPKEYSSILAEGRFAHVGFCEEGIPYVIPFLYHYNPEKPDIIYLHGARSSRALRLLADGAPVCVTVTLLDGLVYSRTALHHSANYRSVMCFGAARRISKSGEKDALFRKMIKRYFAGRSSGKDYEVATAAQLDATELLEVQVNSWSAKARRGEANGPKDSDPNAPGSAGVIKMNS